MFHHSDTKVQAVSILRYENVTGSIKHNQISKVRGIRMPSLNHGFLKVSTSKQGRLKLAQSILPLPSPHHQAIARTITNRRFKEGLRMPH